MTESHEGKSHSAEAHKHEARKKLKISLITASSTRFKDPSLGNESGERALALCKRAGHEATLEVVDDDKQVIRLRALKSLFEDGADSCIVLGGTGLAPRDVTIEAISPLLDKHLDGFGEIFRELSYNAIGSPAIMTRSLAGVIATKPVFCLPGSPDATKIGMELILKELPHAAFIASTPP
jgi:molybdopterin adenylyltransferase